MRLTEQNCMVRAAHHAGTSAPLFQLLPWRCELKASSTALAPEHSGRQMLCVPIHLIRV